MDCVPVLLRFGDDSPLVAQMRDEVRFLNYIPGGFGGTKPCPKAYERGRQEAIEILLAANQRIEAAPDESPTYSPVVHHAKDLAYTKIHTTKREALEKLRAAVQEVPKDKDCESEIFHDWFNRTLADVRAIFGNDSDEAQRFSEIEFYPTGKFYVRLSRLQGGRRTIEDEKSLKIRQTYYGGCDKAEKKLREWIELVALEPDVPPNPAPPPVARRRDDSYTHTIMLNTSKADALGKLEAAVKGLPKTKNVRSEIFNVWRTRTVEALKSIFGDKSDIAQRFERINFHSSISSADEHEDQRYEREAYQEACERAETNLNELIELVNLEPDGAPAQAAHRTAAPAELNRSLNKKIFVVHGHDGRLKNAVRAFIKDLDLAPIILHERPDKGRTIIEKFEQESDVGHAVVLATADDLAASRQEIRAKAKDDAISEDDLAERARQNVIGELMNFTSKLGRDKVTLVVDPSVQLPSDILGVIYAPRSEWQLKLMVALIDAGYQFTMQQVREALSIRE